MAAMMQSTTDEAVSENFILLKFQILLLGTIGDTVTLLSYLVRLKKCSWTLLNSRSREPMC